MSTWSRRHPVWRPLRGRCRGCFYALPAGLPLTRWMRGADCRRPRLHRLDRRRAVPRPSSPAAKLRAAAKRLIAAVQSPQIEVTVPRADLELLLALFTDRTERHSGDVLPPYVKEK